MNVKFNSDLEETMFQQKKRSRCHGTPSPAPEELKQLAALELKKRRLLRELVNLECQQRQLEREVELKGIEIPWLTSRQEIENTRSEGNQ